MSRTAGRARLAAGAAFTAALLVAACGDGIPKLLSSTGSLTIDVQPLT